MIPEVTVEKLFNWVEDKPVGSIVGNPLSASQCVVANYVRDTLGHHPFVCSLSLIAYDKDSVEISRRVPTDKEIKIIKLFDSSGEEYVGKTREETLNMLASLLCEDINIPTTQFIPQY